MGTGIAVISTGDWQHTLPLPVGQFLHCVQMGATLIGTPENLIQTCHMHMEADNIYQ